MSQKENNSKSSKNSSKEQSLTMSYLWPIYGRENKMEKLGSFWYKDK